MTFLTTPTTHEQSLSILCMIDEKEKNKESQMDTCIQAIEGNKMNESKKRNDALRSSDIPPTKAINLAPSAQPLPDTNGLYKCLDLASGLHSWLFSFPKLKLKN